jgi:hypothetical protein
MSGLRFVAAVETSENGAFETPRILRLFQETTAASHVMDERL